MVQAREHGVYSP